MRCVGIDLAWSPRNSSGAFALQVENGVAQEFDWNDGLANDDEILRFVARTTDGRSALVAIDAPIAVPNKKGARPCDRAVTRAFGRFQAGAHPANRSHLSRYGGLRGERLAGQIVQELGLAHDPQVARQVPARQLVEVYPHPGMVALFGLDRTLKYKRGPIGQRRLELMRLQRHLLSLEKATPRLRVGREWRQEPSTLRGRAFKRYEDLLDSLFCAYVAAYCWHHGPGHYEIFGDVRSGHILVPVPPEQRPRLGLPPNAG
jgi:predicted RNase H-like nuclease